MTPHYPARPASITAVMGDPANTTGQDAARAQFVAYLDSLRAMGQPPRTILARMQQSGMANHEPLRSWLELWFYQHSTGVEQQQRAGTREVIGWFAAHMDAEMTRQGVARQETEELPSDRRTAAMMPGAQRPQMGQPAVATVPLGQHITNGDAAARPRDTFFQHLDRLRASVDLLPELFWKTEQVGTEQWVQQFLWATAAVAVDALRMARQAVRYYAQRAATRRAPY